MFRVGIGYDVHPFAGGRRLILGGVDIPHEKGLIGHSDADVLVHAIIDALLGGMADGDIGRHFPPDDPELEGASSIELLAQVGQRVGRLSYIVANVDSVVIADEPRISPYVPKMRANIAKALGIDKVRVSVKGKSNEGLGFVGRGEGIASMAVALVMRD